MQLKIQRSQRKGMTGKVIFCLDVRAEYSGAERSDINKYAIGGQVVYNSRAQQRHTVNALAQATRIGGGAAETAKGIGRSLVSLALAKMNLSITIASLGRGHHI